MTKIDTQKRDLPEVFILREPSTDQGTLGHVLAPSYSCFSLELPWRDNKNNISCIPPGRYVCRYGFSPARKSYSYRLENPPWVSQVPDRAGVLIHSGNLAGAKDKGYKSHVLGCILLGKNVGRVAGQLAVLASKPAIREFEEAMAKQSFVLNIMEA